MRFRISQSGVAQCVIVADERTRSIANELSKYLAAITGGRFSVYHPSSVPINTGQIRLMPEAFHNPSTFEIAAAGEVLTIRGDVNAGVVRLLKMVSVKQLLPGRFDTLGTYVPKNPNLSVGPLTYTHTPLWWSRNISTSAAFGGENPRINFYCEKSLLGGGNNYEQWLPRALFDEHRDYFPLIRGQRKRPDGEYAKGWQPCVSNPAVVDLFIENILASGLDPAPVIINDGGGHCECDNCKAMGTLNDRYALFTNRVAGELPDHRIVCLAYGAMRVAPSFRMADNVIAMVANNNVKSTNELELKNVYAQWDAWGKVAEQRASYWHHNGTFRILPTFDLHNLAKRLRYCSDSHGLYFESHVQWPYGDVIPYVIAELLDDNSRSVDEILTDVLNTFYGPAAPAMRDYYDALESGYYRWLDGVSPDHPNGKDVNSNAYRDSIDQFKLLTPDEANDALKHLLRAMEAATDLNAREMIRVHHAQMWLISLAVERAHAFWGGHTAEVEYLTKEIQSYCLNVLEKPPFDQYRLYRFRQLPMYERMRAGELDQEMQ